MVPSCRTLLSSWWRLIRPLWFSGTMAGLRSKMRDFCFRGWIFLTLMVLLLRLSHLPVSVLLLHHRSREINMSTTCHIAQLGKLD